MKLICSITPYVLSREQSMSLWLVDVLPQSFLITKVLLIFKATDENSVITLFQMRTHLLLYFKWELTYNLISSFLTHQTYFSLQQVISSDILECILWKNNMLLSSCSIALDQSYEEQIMRKCTGIRLFFGTFVTEYHYRYCEHVSQCLVTKQEPAISHTKYLNK